MTTPTNEITEADDEIKQLTLFELEELEKTVRAGLATFISVGEALARIKAGQGWKQRNCESFEDYCQREFRITLRHGQRLIEAAETAREVEKITGELPKNEAAAREIKKVIDDKPLLKKVAAELKRGKATLATATAESVAAVVAKFRGAPAATAGKYDAQKMEQAVEQAPIAQALVEIVFCPYCGEIPERYERKGKAWVCSDCKGVVAITVAKAVA